MLQKPANEIRHGALVEVTDEARQRAVLAAHEVIERYMAWRVQGGAQLPANAFLRLRERVDPLLLRS